jgi:hypothetical protein
MPKFKKGDPKPPGSGRKKGTPNKPKPYAIFLQEFMEADKDLFMADFMKLDEKDRCQVRAAIYKYVAPALSSVDVSATVEGESALDKIKNMSEED